jgi:hypothetical protein
MKATPTDIASNSNDISAASVSKAGDIMKTSSSHKGGNLKKIVSYLKRTHLRAEPPP